MIAKVEYGLKGPHPTAQHPTPTECCEIGKTIALEILWNVLYCPPRQKFSWAAAAILSLTTIPAHMFFSWLISWFTHFKKATLGVQAFILAIFLSF